MLKCYPLKDNKKEIFDKLFADYYDELGCGEDTTHLLEEYVLPDYLAGLISIDLLDDGDSTVGFIIYQIDDISNEWCLKEDWGDIREIYVAPSFRRRGSGRFMLYSAEMKLKERGANRAYALPCGEAEQFFVSCGYADSGEFCDDLECDFYFKENLDNTCKGCKN